MITFLQGILAETTPTQIVLDVGGVGYEVLIPVSSFDKLPPIGRELKILTHLSVREDAHVLYGFMSSSERNLFRILIQTVSGIGPKLALNVLSGLTVTAFQAAVSSGDVRSLSQISGVGRKTAERIVVELKDKMEPLGTFASTGAGRQTAAGDPKTNDAIQALISLGLKPNDASAAVGKALEKLGADAPVEAIVRACLKKG